MDREHSYDISGELYNRALNSLAGGVNSNVRLAETPHPLFYHKAKGSKIYDVDGNQYIDYVLGQGPMIFGHSPDFLLQAVAEASESGQLFAGQHLLELEAAEAVKNLVPNAELVRFASSGTEAVEAAFRLARAFTGRNVIIKFEGQYHGWSDSVLFNTAAPLTPLDNNIYPKVEPMSEGIADHSESALIILPWNNFEAVNAVFEQRGDEIAAVITEPIMCNTNCIMPKPGYLQHLKESCDRNDSLLIFDEVITGFRVNAGGAQSLFGITPHLATFAKAAAGGFPVSILTGSKEIMSLIGTGTVMHGGTLNANVMSMAATKSSMEHLSDKAIQTNQKLQDQGKRLMEGLKDINSRLEAGMLIQGPGSVFAVSFTDGREISDYRSHVENSDPDKYALFVSEMMKRGIRINSRGIWFLSESHTDEDIEGTLSAALEVLQLMEL